MVLYCCQPLRADKVGLNGLNGLQDDHHHLRLRHSPNLLQLMLNVQRPGASIRTNVATSASELRVLELEVLEFGCETGKKKRKRKKGQQKGKEDRTERTVSPVGRDAIAEAVRDRAPLTRCDGRDESNTVHHVAADVIQYILTQNSIFIRNLVGGVCVVCLCVCALMGGG